MLIAIETMCLEGSCGDGPSWCGRSEGKRKNAGVSAEGPLLCQIVCILGRCEYVSLELILQQLCKRFCLQNNGQVMRLERNSGCASIALPFLDTNFAIRPPALSLHIAIPCCSICNYSLPHLCLPTCPGALALSLAISPPHLRGAS